MQADNTSYAHEYVIKDHLGNTRVTYRDDNTTASPLGTIKVEEIVQVNHFFPFGLNMEGNWNGSFPEVENKYQFGGKELNSDFGLEWQDFGARFYDPAVSRWTTVDPLADKMRRHSPYNYAFDNPLRFVDPDGMQGEDWVRGKKGAYFDPKITSRGDAIANGVEYLGKELLTTDPKTNAGYFGNGKGFVKKAIIEGVPMVAGDAAKRFIPDNYGKAASNQLENHINMMSETGEKLIEKVIDSQEKKNNKKQNNEH